MVGPDLLVMASLLLYFSFFLLSAYFYYIITYQTIFYFFVLLILLFYFLTASRDRKACLIMLAKFLLWVLILWDMIFIISEWLLNGGEEGSGSSSGSESSAGAEGTKAGMRINDTSSQNISAPGMMFHDKHFDFGLGSFNPGGLTNYEPGGIPPPVDNTQKQAGPDVGFQDESASGSGSSGSGGGAEGPKEYKEFFPPQFVLGRLLALAFLVVKFIVVLILCIARKKLCCCCVPVCVSGCSKC